MKLLVLVLALLACTTLFAGPSRFGYQPAGTTKPNDPELVHDFNAVLESAYQGAFEIPIAAVSPHPELPGVPVYSTTRFGSSGDSSQAAFAFHPSRATFFHGGTGGEYADDGITGANGGAIDSIAEFTIPALTINADLNDRTGYQTAAQVQPWSSVFKPSNNLVESSIGGGGHTVTSLFFDADTSQLCAQIMQDYDVFEFTQDNLVCYQTPDALSSSQVKGYFSLGDSRNEQKPGAEAAHAATWMASIPTQWQTILGGQVLFGGGQNFSILGRLPTGMTLFAGTLDNLPANGRVELNRWMDFWDTGKQMGAHLFPGRVTSGTTWYQHEHMNCDRDQSSYNCGREDFTQSSLVVPWINNWLTVLSYGLQGFIIPNTRTYVVVGTMQGGELGLSYKGNPDYRGTICGGPCRVDENDRYNKYWLFDLDDMVDPAKEPWEVFPYEHGYLPFLDQLVTVDGERSLMVNAGFDLASGRLAVVMPKRHGNFSPGQDALIFSLPSWSEGSSSELLFSNGFE